MILRRLTLIAFTVAIFWESLPAQDLSTSVFPSEDELYEAYALGELDYQQLVRLLEIACHQVDESNAHLLDEIPNLSYFGMARDTSGTQLETRQAEAFVQEPRLPQRANPTRLNYRHRYNQTANGEERSWYRSVVRIDYGTELSADLKIRRELSGNERIVGRGLTLRPNSGLLRELRLGNFSRRLGLGTIVGYRGKVLDRATSIDTETFLFPDYGGQNGLYGRLQFNRLDLQSLVSVERDRSYRITSSAVMVSIDGKKLRPGLIVSHNSVLNRVTAQRISLTKVGVIGEYRYDGGFSNVELSTQVGYHDSPAAIVSEGRHRWRGATVRYAFWAYDSDNVDLSGGSKTGGLRRTVTLEETELEFTSRRSGQRGGLLKTSIPLGKDWRLNSGFLWASLNTDTAEVQWLPALSYKPGSDVTVTVDQLYKRKWRQGTGLDNDTLLSKTRLETVVERGNWRTRSFVIWNRRTGCDDYLTVALDQRFQSDEIGQFDLRLRLEKIDHRSGRVDYWSGFIKNSIYLLENVELSIKLSHIFHRNIEERHRTVLSIDLEVDL